MPTRKPNTSKVLLEKRDMNLRALAIAVCSLLYLAVSGPSLPGDEKVGKKAPSFRVRSGDGKELTSDRLKGSTAKVLPR